jgi:3-oxoisoapionate decarboxylase
VRWCRTGEGNIDLDGYIKKYIELCPKCALSAEVIVQAQPRIYAVHDPKFWDPYKTTPAWEYERFIELAEKGVVPAGAAQGQGGGGRGPASPEVQAQRLATQREDLEVSIKYTKELIARLV